MPQRLLVAMMVGFLTACGGAGHGSTSGSGSGSGGTLARLGIADAKMLLVAGGGTTAATTGASKLYKLTNDGQVLEVTQTCSTQDEKTGVVTEFPCTTNYTAQGVLPAGQDYVYIWFTSGDQVLVRKSDGRAFLADGIGLPTFVPSALAAPFFKTDAAGNVYFLVYGLSQFHYGTVVRVNVSDPAHLTATAATPDTDMAMSFIVDGAGDVIYDVSSIKRAKTAAGAIVDFPQTMSTGIGPPWVGLDGQLYASHLTSSFSGYVGEILQYAFTGSALTTTQTVSWTGNSSEGNLVQPLQGMQPIEMGGSLFFIAISSPAMPGPAGIVEVTSPTAIPVIYSQPPNVGLVGASGSALWFYGQNVAGVPAYFYRWTRTGETQILAPGTYDIVSATVSVAATATFTALRLSAGVKVLAKVDAAGTVTVLDQGTAAQAVTLVPIN